MTHKKAITPVLSIVLLVMLMVGLIAGAYLFIQSLSGKSTEASQKALGQQLEKSKTILRISSVWDPQNNDGEFNVSILNSGPDPLAEPIITNASAYINNIPVNIHYLGSGTVSPGGSFNMYVEADKSANKGNILKIIFGNGATALTTL